MTVELACLGVAVRCHHTEACSLLISLTPTLPPRPPQHEVLSRSLDSALFPITRAAAKLGTYGEKWVGPQGGGGGRG